MNLPFFYNILHCRFLILSSLFFSFTCFGQSESTSIPSPTVFGLENANLEAIAKSKAYHKYVFEVEDFIAFDAQYKGFKKQLKEVVVIENISISEENKEITVVCLDINADNFLYKLKKILHDNGFRLYKYKEEFSAKPIRL
jgi:hypothetical protein